MRGALVYDNSLSEAEELILDVRCGSTKSRRLLILVHASAG